MVAPKILVDDGVFVDNGVSPPLYCEDNRFLEQCATTFPLIKAVGNAIF
jgi:hypothetical protein